MESGINFTLEGLDSIIAQAEMAKKQKELKERKMAKFAEIIQGVASKYASKWCEYDDLEQDLWERVLILIEDCGGVENVDDNLVARVCLNKAVDLYRYHRRRYECKAEYIEGSDVDDSDNLEDYFDYQRSEKFTKGYDLVLIKEVIDLFPVGSRERKYAIMKLVNYGVIDVKDLNPSDQKLAVIIKANMESPEKDKEEDYIRELGYKSHCPGSWTCKKRDMKKLVFEFLSI